MVESARLRGIKPTARKFSTTVPTLLKWIRPYQQRVPSGLIEQARAPRRQPRRTPASIEQRIVALRHQLPTLDTPRLRCERSPGLTWLGAVPAPPWLEGLPAVVEVAAGEGRIMAPREIMRPQDTRSWASRLSSRPEFARWRTEHS